MGWLRFTVGLLALGLLLGLASACDNNGDGEASAEEIAAVEEVINQVLGTGAGDAEFFFGHVTDNLIENVLFSTRDECEASAAECIGEPSPPTSVSATEIDGDTATSTVALDFGTFQMGLVREDDVWMVDSLHASSDEVPEGTPGVDLGLDEFAFDFDEADIPADGNFAFHVTNNGDQVHEVVVLNIPAEGTLQEALEAAGEETPPAGLKVFIEPGAEVDMAFESALTAGRYAMVCFFPDTDDPEGTPHAEKGMIAEFTIE
jgi:hypothetical protein